MEIDTLQIAAGAITGFIASYFVKEAYLERKIKRLEEENEDLDAQVLSLKNAANNRIGIEARRDKAERMSGMMLEFATAMKEPNADIKAVMQTMATKYPDIAMELVKKGMKLV